MTQETKIYNALTEPSDLYEQAVDAGTRKMAAMKEAAMWEEREETALTWLSMTLAARENPTYKVGAIIEYGVSDFIATGARRGYHRYTAQLVIERFLPAEIHEDGSVSWRATARQLKKDGTERVMRKWQPVRGKPTTASKIFEISYRDEMESLDGDFGFDA